MTAEALSASIHLDVPIVRSARVQQVESYFEVPPSERSVSEFVVRLPLHEQPWKVGLLVGPSGSGKTRIVEHLWGPQLRVAEQPWAADAAVVDGFPPDMGIKQVIGLLSSVGFSSPPSWLRPYRVLSNGEQFRAGVARTLALCPDLAVIDEFTSVVDRTVAQIGSSAIAKAVRRADQRLIAATCHYDVVDWLQPDWIYQTDRREFAWRSVGQRPDVFLEVYRTTPASWPLFRHHHYLDTRLNPVARCFVGLIDGQPAAFFAAIPFPHPVMRGVWRGHRLVALPDYQGVSLGNRLIEYVASIFRAAGKRLIVTSSHPAVQRHRARSPLWHLMRKPGMTAPLGRTSSISGMERTLAHMRMTSSFEYVGAPASDYSREIALDFLGVTDRGSRTVAGRRSSYLKAIRGTVIK